MRGAGVIGNFNVHANAYNVSKFFKALRFFKLAMSLSGVESLIQQTWP